MGDDDRGAAKPAAKNPFFDEADAPLPAARSRKAKPAPAMMTAGGVDMARAHASGIAVREAMPEQPVEEAKVVLAVETDPRKVPTHKRLIEGRAARDDGTREAMLPGEGGPNPWSSTAGAAVDKAASPPATAAKTAPAVIAKPSYSGAWTRVALVLVVLLLAAGVARRATVYLHMAEEPPPVARAAAPPVVAPPPVEPAPLSTAAAATAVASAPQPVETTAPALEAPRPIAVVTAEPTATAAPRPVRAPPPPRPTFQPPFELPREKNR